MKLRPLYHHLLVKRDDVKDKIGEIYIPDEAKEQPATGTVLAIGEGRLYTNHAVWWDSQHGVSDGWRGHVEPLRVKPGDRIIFHAYAGSEIADSDTKQTLLLMTEDDVLAIIEPSETPNARPDSQPPTEAPVETSSGGN